MGSREYSIQEVIAQYEPEQHKVMDPDDRPDKLIESPTGDAYTDAITGEQKDVLDTETVPVNRLPLSYQKKIVNIATVFLVGERIKLEFKPSSTPHELMADMLQKVWDDNKLSYKSKELVRIQKSETHCAELWYDHQDTEYWKDTELSASVRRPGVQILAESKGDKLYPVFDRFGVMIAFGRGYTITEGDEEISHFDIYTDSHIVSAREVSGNWEVETKANPYGSIPVIYYHQDRPEWADVQPLIERKESKLSDFADTNDYFASPAIVSDGDVENLPGKGEIGKHFATRNGGSVDILTWDSAPESTKLEFQILDEEIHSLTHTPDISFNSMKALLGNLSGIALKLLFMDAQIKAVSGQEQFLEMMQRRLNLMKKILFSINPVKLRGGESLPVTPTIKQFMPINDVEYNELLIKAYEAGMISKRTMIERSTLVQDAEKELEQMEIEGRSTPDDE